MHTLFRLIRPEALVTVALDVIDALGLVAFAAVLLWLSAGLAGATEAVAVDAADRSADMLVRLLAAGAIGIAVGLVIALVFQTCPRPTRPVGRAGTHTPRRFPTESE